MIRDLVESLYRDDPRGGPDTAESYVRKLITLHRNELADLGWRLSSKSWGGYWIEAVGA
ncbi:hypothetical protein [Mesorhizobium sp.]|uniref:hypothetical protein n=1 Tax=Mesorhizobium sp. TaxID=1871066 RepID=UPI00257DB3F1|nr:hypothetical protein [Mesorhizobium sp.]